MKYRQWKKNYKKSHGENPPLEMDKRKQRRCVNKAVKTISGVDFSEVVTRVAEVITNAVADFMRGLGGAFDTAGTVCRDVADHVQPIEIKERVSRWQVREYGNGNYAVCEICELGGEQIGAFTHSKKAAEKITEILENDYLEYTRLTSPDRITYRNDEADSLCEAIITAYESGVCEG